jgi:hypothetical protein
VALDAAFDSGDFGEVGSESDDHSFASPTMMLHASYVL